MKKYKVILLTMLISAGLYSCSDDSDDLPNGETANVKVELTDAPGDYDEVWIDIVDVMVQTNASVAGGGESDEQGWVSLEGVNTGTYDLLTLTGGTTQLLADATLPAGTLNQIRLVLGNGNSVVVEGTEFSLKTPSAQESGLKLQVNENLEAGQDYVFLLDFDVEESVVPTSEGNYNLKPVIRVSTQEAGSIIGEVHPTDQQTLVVATNGAVTVSAYTSADGKFALHGLPSGTYKVIVTPDVLSGLSAVTVNDVAVEAGAASDLEVVFLE